MFIVCPSTLWNANALETQSTPKRIFGRVLVLPRVDATLGLILRLVLEVQILRYLLPLSPFAVAMFIWRDLALPIAQAPIVMLIVIGFVEMQLLTVKPEKRHRMISDADMARVKDALRFNATRILTRIAALRDMQAGEILLVVEQSELAHIPPLTLVSVQQSAPSAEVLDLSAAERAIIADLLFQDDLTERSLHLTGLRENDTLHSIALDARGVSAHARMAALLDMKRAEAA